MMCVPFSTLEYIRKVCGKNTTTHPLGPSISGLPCISGCVLFIVTGKQGDPLWSGSWEGDWLVPITGLHGSPGTDQALEVTVLDGTTSGSYHHCTAMSSV